MKFDRFLKKMRKIKKIAIFNITKQREIRLILKGGDTNGQIKKL